MTVDVEDRSMAEVVVAIWATLQRVGAPTGVWVARRVWDNAVRVTCGVESQMGIRNRTKLAKDLGILELDSGHRGKQGRIKLVPLGDPGQFIPLDVDLEGLLRTPEKPSARP